MQTSRPRKKANRQGPLSAPKAVGPPSTKPRRKAPLSSAALLDASVARAESAIDFLAQIQPSLPASQTQEPPVQLDPCSPPDKTPPQFVIGYSRPASIASLLVPGSSDPDNPILPIPDFFITCAKVQPPPDGLQFYLGVDLKFEQTWNLRKLAIGDLSSTLSLAPSEQLTLEFQSSQRRLLEQTRVDSAEEMISNESTLLDKEVLNVARASSKTENWHVDGNGGFDIGIVSLGASAGIQSSLTQNSQSSVEHITEATRKSARSLKTLHKIEVRGVTEGLIQNRMTRVIKNPYPDRSLSLNVFQLIKHFSISSALVEIRPALIVQINGLVFDDEFVISHSDFLQVKLIDQSLLDELPTATQGAKPVFSSGVLQSARDAAKLALRYLYDEPNVFNMPNPLVVDFPPRALGDPNPPETSFNASISGGSNLNNTGLGEALNVGVAGVFTTLNLFFKIYREMLAANALDTNDNAIWMATALADAVGEKWKGVIEDPQNLAKGLLDEHDFTEIFRRLSGFLAIAKGRLDGLMQSAAQDQQAILAQAAAVYALDRLKKHLDCNRHYYTQQFLTYIAQKTDNQAIVDFVEQLIDSTKRFSITLPDALRQAFDIERAFISKQTIIVPSTNSLTEAQIVQFGGLLSTAIGQPAFHFADIPPTVQDLQVPCDGIHLETAPGLCVLADIPQPPTKSFDLSVQNANLQVSAP